jgi:hypothetical protein
VSLPAQERREDLIRRQLDDLGALCADLGEEVKAAVMEVHPNLVYMWDAEAARVLRDVYRLGSSYSSTVGGMVDLGDTTISRLGSKILVMKDLKVGPAGYRHQTQAAQQIDRIVSLCSWSSTVLNNACAAPHSLQQPPLLLLPLLLLLQASRGAHASELLSVLNSLWDATDVPDQERSHFLRMMSGPLRLHGASLEKVSCIWGAALHWTLQGLCFPHLCWQSRRAHMQCEQETHAGRVCKTPTLILCCRAVVLAFLCSAWLRCAGWRTCATSRWLTWYWQRAQS